MTPKEIYGSCFYGKKRDIHQKHLKIGRVLETASIQVGGRIAPPLPDVG